MSSDATLNEGYVLSRVEDQKQLRGDPAEKASRVHQKKGTKCLKCQGLRHIERSCPGKNDGEDARSATEKGKGRKNGKKLSKQDKKTTKQKGRSAQDGDYKGAFGEKSDAEELGALAQEIHEYARFVKESAHYVRVYMDFGGPARDSTGMRSIISF